jgi:type I restriction enzyme S subunit
MIYSELADLPLDRAPLLRTGEVLVVRSGAYTGDSAIVTDEWSGSAPGYDLRLTPEGINPGYLSYSMLSAGVIQQINCEKSRAAQPHLNAEDLGNLVISLPGWEEQCRITEFLDIEVDRIDKMIAARCRQDSLLGESYEAELDGYVHGLMAKYGTITLRRISNGVQQGWSPQCEEVAAEMDEWAVLKTSSVSSGTFRPLEHKRLPTGVDPDLRFVISDGELLLTRGSGSSDLVGVSAVAEARGRKLLLSDLLYRINLLEGWPASLVSAVINSPIIRGKISLLMRGQSGQTIKLRAEDVKNIELPNIPLARRFGIDVDLKIREYDFANLRRVIHGSSYLLEERKRALITAAVTGQIDVTTARGADVS